MEKKKATRKVMGRIADFLRRMAWHPGVPGQNIYEAKTQLSQSNACRPSGSGHACVPFFGLPWKPSKRKAHDDESLVRVGEKNMRADNCWNPDLR